MYRGAILVEGRFQVRRKMFWVERYGYIQEGKGLVYAKSRKDMAKARTVALKGKKLMKGKRKLGPEYLAVCTGASGEDVEIKICFDDEKEMNKWAKTMAAEMKSSPASNKSIVDTEQENTSVQSISRSSNVNVRGKELLEGAKGDEPIEDISPKVRKRQSNIPGYVSKFTQYINDQDKGLLETAEDMFTRRTDWNLDRSGSAALYYTSKTLSQIDDDRRIHQEIIEVFAEDRSDPFEVLTIPAILALLAGVNLLAFILPSSISLVFALLIFGASIFILLMFKKRLDKHQEEKATPQGFKSYKIKLVTNVVGLPDDVASALTDIDKRKQWDLYHSLLKEETSKIILYRKSASCCQILEQRISDTNTLREVFMDLQKIKGKPYFLRLCAYTTVTQEMFVKMGDEGVQNNFNSLRNFVLTDDSVSELNLSLANIKSDGGSFIGNPILTITDMIEEIQEVDEGIDAKTENEDEEESKDVYQDFEEVKVAIGSPPSKKRNPVEQSPIKDTVTSAPETKKEMSFDEKFELELQNAPADEQPFIKKAKDAVQKLLDLANSPNWTLVNSKPNNVFSMDAEGGLKCIKGEGFINYTPKEIAEYLKRENVQKDYDDQFAEGGTVQQLSMETSFVFNRFKGVFMVSGRDFCMLAIRLNMPDGRVIISSTSHEHEDCPPHKKYVRAELIRGGWILTPDKENPSRTFAQYISQSDLKGNIPKSIVNSVAEKQGLLVSKIEQAMKKNF